MYWAYISFVMFENNHSATLQVKNSLWLLLPAVPFAVTCFSLHACLLIAAS